MQYLHSLCVFLQYGKGGNMRVYSFDAAKARDEAVEWIKKEAERAHFNKVVLGISGGKDSTIAAALCCKALGPENVHGLLMPNGIQTDIDDSIEVCKTLGIKYDTINIKPIYDMFIMQYGLCTLDSDIDYKDCNTLEDMINKTGTQESKVVITEDALINLAPRIRMTILRLWGQSHHHRLCGTGNFSEITVGYCTKDGDTSNDFNPLGRLTSIEVVEIGLTMDELPRHLVIKTPSDGLSGKTDEEKLGLKYEDIHKYIRGLELDKETWNKIHEKELAGLHKRSKVEFVPSDQLLYVN